MRVTHVVVYAISTHAELSLQLSARQVSAGAMTLVTALPRLTSTRTFRFTQACWLTGIPCLQACWVLVKDFDRNPACPASRHCAHPLDASGEALPSHARTLACVYRR